MITARTILLFFHIIAAGLWVTSAVLSFVFARIVRAEEGKPYEVNLMLVQGRVLSAIGSLGGMGILITGFGLIGVEGLGFLGIAGGITPTWLFIKQVIYIIAMVVVFAGIVPTQRKLAVQLTEAAQHASGVTPEMRALSQRVQLIGRLNDLLIVVNIFLAVWKPI